MLKETGQGNWEIYLDRIGLFFIFTACAGAIFCIILLIKELHGG